MHDRARSHLSRHSHAFWFWRCALGFWRGNTAWASWGLTAFLIAVVLLGLVTQYRLNLWNRDFFDALERKDGMALRAEALLFVPLALASIALAILGVWGRMSAQRKWREWMSRYLIQLWLVDDRHRRLSLLADDHQNPEYRIAEDARVATDAPVDFAVGLLTSLLTAFLFVGVLWNVGGDLDTDAFGGRLVIPGYLVIAAIGYAAVTTTAMLIIGRRLVHVFEGKNQAEAELRRAATRLRENALLADSATDRDTLQASLMHTMAWWRDLCWQLLQTTFISHGNFLLAPVVALTLCAPKYLAGTLSLGEVAQAAAAFVIVQGAFNWLVDNYPRLADWASSANRVGSLLVSLRGLDPEAEAPRAVVAEQDLAAAIVAPRRRASRPT